MVFRTFTVRMNGRARTITDINNVANRTEDNRIIVDLSTSTCWSSVYCKTTSTSPVYPPHGKTYHSRFPLNKLHVHRSNTTRTLTISETRAHAAKAIRKICRCCASLAHLRTCICTCIAYSLTEKYNFSSDYYDVVKLFKINVRCCYYEK